MIKADHNLVIVGAGQGGLSVSYFLNQAGIDHTILDRGGVAHAWSAHRWDSFCLVTPNWAVNLPGQPYNGDDPDGFMLRDDFVRYLKTWAEKYCASVTGGVDVKRITRQGDHFVLDTNQGSLTSRNVVVATATYQHPKVPAISGEIPASVRQIHAETYKNCDQAADGAIIVVGSGQTGSQIVEDCIRAGRKAYLCVAKTGRLPRRYRGRDCLHWQADMGLLDRTPDMLDHPSQRFVGDPHLTGRDRGMTVSMYGFHNRGVTLVGRLEGVENGVAKFRDDLGENLEHADAFCSDLLGRIDDYIEANNIPAPKPTASEVWGGPELLNAPVEPLRELDLRQAGINTVIWATGFSFDFSWIDNLGVDSFGYPTTNSGQSSIPGLYFCGLNWMTKRKSGILYGVEEDAQMVASEIVDQMNLTAAQFTILGN